MAGKQRRRSRELIFAAELVDEILVRLPMKSVLRFESVSKSWLSNLRSTLFKQLYEQRNNIHEPDSVHTMNREDLYRMIPSLQRNIGPPKPFDIEYNVSIMGPSSKGIWCLISVPQDAYNTIFYARCQIVLFNPAISQFNLLPPYPSHIYMSLMHNSPVNQVVCGFDTSTVYSVVFIVHYGHRPSCFLVLVYNSSSREWERLVDHVPNEKTVGPPSATEAFTRGHINRILSPLVDSPQTLFNGCWHWMIEQDERQRQVDWKLLTLLSFDFAHQSFHLIKGPPNISPESTYLAKHYVAVLHDHLIVIQSLPGLNETDLSISMMMEYGDEESWTKIFNVHSSYYGSLNRLYKVDYFVEVADKGQSDVIFIKRLLFTWGGTIISVDHDGGYQVTRSPHSAGDIFLNTGGISCYKKTLERP